MIKLFFVGDIINKEEGKSAIVSDELYNIINSHDIRCCNFEAPIVDNLNIEKIKKARTKSLPNK